MTKILFAKLTNSENLDKIRFVFLMGLLFSLPFRKCQVAISIFLIGFILTSGFLFYKQEEKDLSQIPYLAPMASIICLALLALFFTNFSRYALKKTYSDIILSFLSFFLLVTVPLSKRQLRMGILCFLVSLAVSSLIGFWEIKNGVTWKRSGYLLHGGAGEMGVWFSIGLPYTTLIYQLNIKSKWKPLLTLTTFSIFFMALLSTKTRASFIAFLVMALFAVFVYKRLFVLPIMGTCALLILLTSTLLGHGGRLGLITFIKSAPTEIINFFAKTPDEILRQYDKKDSSLSRRLAMWKQALTEVTKSPLRIRGYGNIFGRDMDKKYGYHKTYFYRNLHSEFFTILYGLGIIGCLLFVWLTYLVFKNNWITNVSFSSSLPDMVQAATILMTVGFIVNSLFWVYRKEVFIGYWILVGFSQIASSRVDKSEEKLQPIRGL